VIDYLATNVWQAKDKLGEGIGMRVKVWCGGWNIGRRRGKRKEGTGGIKEIKKAGLCEWN